jgi:PIN domain nuclease of toxin-antitoxin system
VIVLDTHIWVWWVQGDVRLGAARAVERGRLTLPCDIDAWLTAALGYPGVQLLPLSPQIAAESTRLPGEFHQDPADQIIVATARVLGCSLLTADAKIRAYTHVILADGG